MELIEQNDYLSFYCSISRNVCDLCPFRSLIKFLFTNLNVVNISCIDKNEEMIQKFSEQLYEMKPSTEKLLLLS